MFPNLKAEMARNDVSVLQIAKALGVTRKTFENKMNGVSQFKVTEMWKIQGMFPDCSLAYLFEQKRA